MTIIKRKPFKKDKSGKEHSEDDDSGKEEPDNGQEKEQVEK